MSSEAFDTLVDDFQMFDDWEERYRYVIELGKDLPPFDDALKTDATLVEGCVSRVWLKESIDEDGRVRFDGDSDAHIVRGLIALLRALYSGRAPQEILDEDAMAALGRIDLSSHLSPQRSNGLHAMIRRIRGFAAAHA